MPIEKRTRVEIFLPVRSDLAAYGVSLEWLAEELALIRGRLNLDCAVQWSLCVFDSD